VRGVKQSREGINRTCDARRLRPLGPIRLPGGLDPARQRPLGAPAFVYGSITAALDAMVAAVYLGLTPYTPE
jgi:hypothetical protein